jgi:hypothetical protein
MRDWMTNRLQRIPPDELRMLGELERKVLWLEVGRSTPPIIYAKARTD